jgi:exopolyphosphatase/guanosine-5'-triphosphate,3'-diphosphate pyrophosphatase
MMPGSSAALSSRGAKPNNCMPCQIRAVIDVGTNSVKLLVAEVDGGIVKPLHESSHQTRLGRGFYESHILQTKAIRETANTVADFRATAASWNPASLRVIATSAARDAQNQDELLGAISAASGLRVDIISGEQEADWAYRGVASDRELAAGPLLVIDVGGGSTEFIVGHDGHRHFAESFPIGSVRFLEKVPVSDPPTSEELASCERELSALLKDRVQPRLLPVLSSLHSPVQLVGTGGTSTILARVELRLDTFDREKIEGTVLSHADIVREKHRLWSLPLSERRTIIGLPANRADVILPGIAIFEQVMACFGFRSLRVSTRGIRFAALMDN